MLPYSQLRNSPRISLVDAIPLPAPMTIHIEPGNGCNFRCSFCPESFTDYRERAGGIHMLKLPDFERIVAQIKELGRAKVINFHMLGEPFANRNLTAFIALARRENIADRLIVTTNGTLMTPDKDEAICRSGLDYLRVSVYGCDQEHHAKRTQSKIPLTKVVANIAALKDWRNRNGFKTPYICVKYVTNNTDEAATFKLLFDGIGDEAYVEALHNWAYDPNEQINLAGIERDAMLKQDFFATKTHKDVCPFPFYTLVIHSDLQVGVCCVDWEKGTVVGDLKTDTLKEVWQGQPLREFRLKHVQRRRSEIPVCAKCTYLHSLTDNIDALTEDKI